MVLLNRWKNKIVEVGLVIMSTLIELITSLIIVKLAAMYLVKADYGFYSLILSIFTLFSLLPFTSLHTGISRYIIDVKNKGYLSQLYIHFWGIHLSFFIIYSLLCLFAYNFLSSAWKELMFFLFLFCCTKIYKQFLFCILNTRRKRGSVVLGRIIDLVIEVSLILLFVCDILTIKKLLFSSIIGSLCVILFFVYIEKSDLVVSNIRMTRFKYLLKEILSFSTPLIIWGIFGWLQSMVARWFIDSYLSKEDVANFSALFSMALLPATALLSIVSNFFTPISYEHEYRMKGTIRMYVHRVLIWGTLIWGMLLLFVYLLGDWMIVLFLDEKYLNVLPYLPYVMIGTGIYAMGQIAVIEMYYYKLQYKLLFPTILPGCLTFIGCYLFIQDFGIKGAILNNAVTYAIYGILYIIYAFYYSKKLRLNNYCI